jgi:hypothetical protein
MIGVMQYCSSATGGCGVHHLAADLYESYIISDVSKSSVV